MARWAIREADLDETFIRGGGPGGQNVNKVATCVVLRHRPTGIEVRCARERSQAVNRLLARRLLCDRVEALVTGRVAAEVAARERIRRQKRRRSRRAKAKMLDAKRRRAETKHLRRRPGLDE
jgi:protein subunit release factor B